MRAGWPCTEDLAFEPELTALDAALAIAIQSLIARNPEVHKPKSSARKR